jgi:hypothetical protein
MSEESLIDGKICATSRWFFLFFAGSRWERGIATVAASPPLIAVGRRESQRSPGRRHPPIKEGAGET